SPCESAERLSITADFKELKDFFRNLFRPEESLFGFVWNSSLATRHSPLPLLLNSVIRPAPNSRILLIDHPPNPYILPSDKGLVTQLRPVKKERQTKSWSSNP